MESTKLYFIRALTIYLGIAALIGAIAAFAIEPDGNLISYYCSFGNPFLGIHFEKFAACPLYISIGYVLWISAVLFLAGLLISYTVDLVRLKTERIFQLTANEPMTYPPNVSRWASVKIKNVSGEILKNCLVNLEDVLDDNGHSVLRVKRSRTLLWSWGDRPREPNKDFSPEDEKVIDVATTDPANKHITFDTQEGRESKDEGTYEVIIAVKGEMNGRSKTKRERFTVRYRGRNIITIVKKGDPEWQNPDPQPPKTKGRKTPPVSLERSS